MWASPERQNGLVRRCPDADPSDCLFNVLNYTTWNNSNSFKQFSLSSMNLCTMSATVLLILKLVATNLAMNVPQSSERLGSRKINPNLRNQESKYLLGEETSISQLWCELAHPASGRALTIAIWTLKWALQQAQFFS
ncbi:hypothetical protein PGTUg99_021560 [Puccinia graminis f. sp. tritici]|uniref:Uncharacterized protein n=1 Tax=Puccinia graminis f. sp. tritici TaxID=56615 RepID=A0A5B0PGC2_PUCGR|nr:hypothetical protein PGTUg99_021560 [Puccinia graminis f. sp. tritici]